MELSQLDPSSGLTRPDEPELDLYTIPSHSSWFVWDEIHETERVSLREFFDGSSISRTPKIYKEYRDFIINKYREEPSRRLTFTEVRKSLVGDVNLLRKVFLFLEKWGLINFSAPPSAAGDGCEARGGEEERARVRVKVEEGVPNGIRVVATPNSIKPITAELARAAESKKEDSVPVDRVKLPPLASYSDVIADLIKHKDVVACGNCGDRCNSGHYECTKEDFSICTTCFESGNYGENKSVDDYKFCEGIRDSHKYGAVWSEAETLLLLESVLKYGDDWELVTQNLPTKTKLDCIAKLIELPFGEVSGSATLWKGNNSNELTGNTNGSKQDPPSFENQETVKIGDQHEEKTNEGGQSGDAMEEDPPLKRQRIASLSGLGGSLLEQVARISTIVDPYITAAVADAAITSLCEENSWPREIFDADDDDDDDDAIADGLPTSIADTETMRGVEVEDSEMEGGPALSENQDVSTKKDDIPLTLRIRTAVATALGAAAARAKLLADQEEREIENLVATIIGTEMKKLCCKIKHFEDLEVIMKMQHAEMEEIEEILLAERINVLKAVFKAGIPRWKNHSSLRS